MFRSLAAIALTACLLPSAAAATTLDMTFETAPTYGMPESLIVTPQTPLDALKAQLSAIVADFPDDAASWHKLGTVLYHLGETEDAAEAWSQAATLDPLFAPADVMADVQQVFLLQREGDPEAARAHLALAEERHAEAPHFYLLRAEQAMRSRNTIRAEQDYLKAHELAPGSVATNLNLAQFLEFQGLQQKARAHYEAATEAAPDHPLAWDSLAAHQFSAGETDAALQSLREAERAGPRQPLAELRLAALHSEVGDRIGARHWYRQALPRAQSGQEAILIALSDAQMRLGLLDEAAESIDKVLENGASAPVLVARGYIDEQAGDLDRAIERYRAAIRLDPGNLVAANNLAMALIRADDNPEEALVHAGYAYETRPDNAAIFGTHAAALAFAGKTAEARDALAKAIRIAPDDPWLRYFNGLLLAESGRAEAARMHLEAVLILDPAFPRAEDVRGRLATLN